MTDVSISPSVNEWATVSIDGHCRIFRYPAFKMKVTKPTNPSGGL